MAAPKTDTSGQVVQPRAITHFGDGDTPLTNRDVSLDLKALVDDSIKGLLRSIGDPGATPANYTTKTVLKLLEDIRAAVATSGGAPGDKIASGKPSLPATSWTRIYFAPAAGELWEATYIRAKHPGNAAGNLLGLYWKTPDITEGVNDDNLRMLYTSGPNSAIEMSAPRPWMDNTRYLYVGYYNADIVAVEAYYIFCAVKRA